MSNKMSKNGFTIIEVMVAVFIVTVGVLTSYSAAQRIFVYTFSASSRLTAAFLAQEGIELVRNMRDTNWVASNPVWNANLIPGTYRVSYDNGGLIYCTAPCDYNSDPNFLKITDGNKFNYGAAGVNTKFKRRVTITNNAANSIEVTVDVMWQERGSINRVTVKGYLYDWMGS